MGYFNWLISEASSFEEQVVLTPRVIAVRIAVGGILAQDESVEEESL